MLALGVCQVNLVATTVSPPEFESLVHQADYVVRGTVKSVSSKWRGTNSGDRHIFTFVAIEVGEVIAGTPPSPLVLEMLGGRVGNDQMTIQGSPLFFVGDEHILFIRGNGVQFNPLVALMHGQYPVKKDGASGRSYVVRSDGSPLKSENDVALPMHSAASAQSALPSARSAAATPRTATSAAQSALTPHEFTARIRTARAKTSSSNEK
jgi:hypothetical protein